MSKKGENIRKRKDGRWEGRYKNGFKGNGASRYSSVYGKSYTEVKNKLIYVKSEIAVYQRNPFVEKKFGDILLLWLKSNQIKVKKSTEAKYMYMLSYNDNYHSGYVEYDGVVGRYYKAYVCIWGGGLEVGDARYFYTSAKKATLFAQ